MTVRTIESVYDDDTGREISAAELLNGPEEALHRLRYETTVRHHQGNDRYYCPKCKGSIWPSLARGGYFNHYAPADPDCEWYTGKPGSLSEINRERFLFHVESPLHKRLVQFIYDMTLQDQRFSGSVKDRERVVDLQSGQWRKPDVWARFRDWEVVFELQLSRTWLKEIVGREVFYSERGTFVVWVFHGFKGFRDFAAAKDIYYANHANALELDHEAEAESLKAGKLMLKAHWYGFEPDESGAFALGWHSQIVDLDELVWDQRALKPYFGDPLTREFSALRERHRDWLELFEKTWLADREEHVLWEHRAMRKAWNRFVEFLSHRTLPTSEAAREQQFARAIDQIFAVRDDRWHFGKENLVAATNTLLEHRGWFTTVLIAAAKAYGREKLLEVPSVARKIRRNLGLDGDSGGIEQAQGYEPVIGFLFPETIEFLSNEPELNQA